MQDSIPLSRIRRTYHVEWMDDMINPALVVCLSAQRSAAQRSVAQHNTALL